jgi:hypothetical protein
MGVLLRTHSDGEAWLSTNGPARAAFANGLTCSSKQEYQLAIALDPK